MNCESVQISNSWLLLVTTVAMCLQLVGCNRSVQTGYGRPTGIQHSTSINGTRVFHEMIRASGRDVDRYSKFSPRWEKYDTVFWMPDNYIPPSVELIQQIEDWLTNKGGRKLVFVARDYDASLNYWEKLGEQSNDPNFKDLYRRKFHDSTTNPLNRASRIGSLDCAWYELVQYPNAKAESIDGSLASGLEFSQPDVRYGLLPKPGAIKLQNGKFGNYDAEILMHVDSLPFIYSLKKQRYKPSEIVVVGNASFLLNLPLANAGNRQLANNLIYYATENNGYSDPVLFIENQRELPIAQRDSPDIESQWSWIAQKPLRYIVPHVLFCCLLFCFVYFPIFGRPRKQESEKTANFQDHVDAVGQLIKNTKSFENPDLWIDEYRRRSSKNRNS